jgi:hypothetical protein
VKNFFQIIPLSPPNLAYFAPWRESIPLFEYFNSAEHLPRPRKFSRIVARSLESLIYIGILRDLRDLGGEKFFRRSVSLRLTASLNVHPFHIPSARAGGGTGRKECIQPCDIFLS